MVSVIRSEVGLKLSIDEIKDKLKKEYNILISKYLFQKINL